MKYLAVSLLTITAAAFAQEDLDVWEDDWDDAGGLQWSGFIEGALGSRLSSDPSLPDSTLRDARARLETEWSGDSFLVAFKGGVLYDGYTSEVEGELRDFNLAMSPAETLDVKLGRQVLTWGTGDLLFLNDLFPKSWVNFFAGRDDEYLKDPSDAVRVTSYTDTINIDFVWTPEFEPDDYLTGDRFSFFSPAANGILAPTPPLSAEEPNKGELAARFFRNIGSTEIAFYLYEGYFKRPIAFDESMRPAFAPLSVLGASARRPLSKGLFNFEFAYHLSKDDRSGVLPGVPNDQLRFLVGYDFEAVTNLNVGFQYYLEWTQDHDALVENAPNPSTEPDEYRHVLTNRLTYRALQDKLMWSLFTFYSPSDDDYHMRPVVTYRQNDRWSYTGGMNLFGGRHVHTFFGQLEDNSNAYFRVRFNY
jgi:hypothetical protein